MAEYFDLMIRKACPGCSENCPMFEAEIKESWVSIALIGECKSRYIQCKNQQICQECWERSIAELNRIGEKTAFRTVWGRREE